MDEVYAHKLQCLNKYLNHPSLGPAFKVGTSVISGLKGRLLFLVSSYSSTATVPDGSQQCAVVQGWAETAPPRPLRPPPPAVTPAAGSEPGAGSLGRC